jgi:Mrp family chromosome partitioning ATPase
MIAQEMSTTVWNAETVAHKLGLPILAKSAPSRASERAPGKVPTIGQSEARALALRIRQYVPDPGALIMFSSLNEGNEVDNLVADASRYLAMRDEKILILDARIANTQLDGLPRLIDRPVLVTPSDTGSTDPESSLAGLSEPIQSGLVQYMVFEGQNVDNFIFPTKTRSVDYMPAGGPYPVTDVLASQPMKDLLESLRKKYTLIFVVGPAVSKNIDTEILAAYVHGMIVILNGSVNSFSAEAEQFVQSLKEANAPLLGSVICV